MSVTSNSLVPPFTSISPLAVLHHCLWCGLLATQSIIGSINTALQDAPSAVTIAKFSITNLCMLSKPTVARILNSLLIAHCSVYKIQNELITTLTLSSHKTSLCTTINYAASSFGHPNNCVLLPAIDSLFPQPCLGMTCTGQR